MKSEVNTTAGTVRPGMKIQIIHINDQTTMFPGGVDKQARSLNGAKGTITFIDDSGAIHGTWGSLSVIPEEDTIQILN